MSATAPWYTDIGTFSSPRLTSIFGTCFQLYWENVFAKFIAYARTCKKIRTAERRASFCLINKYWMHFFCLWILPLNVFSQQTLRVSRPAIFCSNNGLHPFSTSYFLFGLSPCPCFLLRSACHKYNMQMSPTTNVYAWCGRGCQFCSSVFFSLLLHVRQLFKAVVTAGVIISDFKKYCVTQTEPPNEMDSGIGNWAKRRMQ